MITPIYAALLGLMLIALSVNVIQGRWHFKIGLGNAKNIEMKRRTRAQANLAEYAPIFIILLGFAEQHHLWHWAVHLFGLIFLLGRIMHAYSLLKAEIYKDNQIMAKPVWRIRGMLCTFSTIVLLAFILLFQSLI